MNERMPLLVDFMSDRSVAVYHGLGDDDDKALKDKDLI
jgi:hypothetical protein